MSPEPRPSRRVNRLPSVLLIAVVTLIARGPTAGAETKFPPLSVAPEIGYRFFGPGSLEEQFDARIEARHGVVVKAHVTTALDRWTLDLAPSFTRQLSDGFIGDLSAFGGEAAVRYYVEHAPFFPTAGIGFHGAYLFPTDTSARGCELYGRAAVGFTWIFFPHLGLTAETAFLAGATGIRFKDGPGIQHLLSERMRFAFTVGAELTVGIRFP